MDPFSRSEYKQKELFSYVVSIIGLIWFGSFFIYKLIAESVASLGHLIGILLLLSVYKNKRQLLKSKKSKAFMNDRRDFVTVEQLQCDYSNCDDYGRQTLRFTNNSPYAITGLWIEASSVNTDQVVNFRIKSTTLPKQTTFNEVHSTKDKLVFHKIGYSYCEIDKSVVSIEYDCDTKIYNTNLSPNADTNQVRNTRPQKIPKKRKWLTRIAFTYLALSVFFNALLASSGK